MILGKLHHLLERWFSHLRKRARERERDRDRDRETALTCSQESIEMLMV